MRSVLLFLVNSASCSIVEQSGVSISSIGGTSAGAAVSNVRGFWVVRSDGKDGSHTRRL